MNQENKEPDEQRRASAARADALLNQRVWNKRKVCMSIDKISEWNNQVYQRTEIKKADQRHNEAVVEQQQTKARREQDDLKRIEMNRYMNRAGQNVDRMA